MNLEIEIYRIYMIATCDVLHGVQNTFFLAPKIGSYLPRILAALPAVLVLGKKCLF